MNQPARVAVITGASRGIGAGLARHFHDQGVHVALCARSEPALAAGDRVLTDRFDIGDEDAVQRFSEQVVARFGHIDVWINNAGVLDPIAPLREVAVTDLRRHLDTNLIGSFLGSRAFARLIHDSARSGVLINISSGAATRAFAGWGAYCASKAALDLMSRCLQEEERAAGLRVHAVAPGIIDTDMQGAIRACTPEQFPTVEAFRGYRERQAFNTIEFVAEKLYQLAFDAASTPADVVVELPAQYPDRF